MSQPEMVPVDSTSIVQIGYDAAAQELFVEFLEGGRVYVYSNVPQSTHEELMSSDSKGSYFNREIKPNYECRPL